MHLSAILIIFNNKYFTPGFPVLLTYVNNSKYFFLKFLKFNSFY